MHGESDIEGAIREVMEETGYRVKLGRPLGEITYEKTNGGVTRPKVVRYWAMYVDGGLFTASREVDILRWMPVNEAASTLSHERDREVLDRFVKGPIVTRSVLLVRHASAGSRAEWKSDDRDRPLDDIGREQADELVWLLTRFDVREIISADVVRCVETMKPLADAVGLGISLEPLLSETGYPGSETEAEKLVRSLVADGVATVLCSQGDVIPNLLKRLAQDEIHLPDPQTAKKGSCWSLTFDRDQRLWAAEYFPPPQLLSREGGT